MKTIFIFTLRGPMQVWNTCVLALYNTYKPLKTLLLCAYAAQL